MQELRPASSQRYGRGCLVFFALIWTGFALFWTLMAFRSGGGFVPLLVGGLFTLLGIGMMVGAFWRTIAGAKVAPPRLTVSTTTLRPGEEFSVQYDQSFRMASEVMDNRVDLVFRESATYTQGTDTRTDTHDEIVDFFEGPIQRYEAGESMQERSKFQIPSDAMHTFVGSNNKLQWLIRVRVDVQGWPDTVQEYELSVLPERIQ